MKSRPLFLSSQQTQMTILGTPEIQQKEIPVCKTCKSEMNFIYSLKSNDRFFLIFQCQADPGMCDDWDPNAGGNSVLEYKDINIKDVAKYIILGEEELDNKDIIDLLEKDNNCIGKFGGIPLWIQGNETPECECGKTMHFLAQIEQHAHPDFNFGGSGCSYIFTCKSCNKSKFLWQS